MISIHSIADFLNKQTSNYEIYTERVNQLFVRFLTRIQSYVTNKSLYKWKMLSFQSPRPNGFTLQSSMISPDNRMAIWSLADSSDRVSFSLSCTDDAGLVPGWQVRRDGLKKEQEAYPTWTIRSLEDDHYLTIISSNKMSTPSMVLYYKGYDACYAEINYTDAKKDAKSLETALRFLKK